MKTKNLTIIILISLLFLFSCKKEDDNNTPSTNNNPTTENLLEDYIVFPIGTKWIYYNEFSNTKDTFELVNQDTITFLGIKTYQQKYISTNSFYGLHIYNDAEFPNEENNDISIQVYYQGFYVYHNQKDTVTYAEVKLLETLDTLTIKGTVYNKVRKFQVNDDGNILESYVAKNFGLIKSIHYVENDTIILELDRFEIGN